MASTSDIIHAMNNVMLENEEEGGLVIEEEDGIENTKVFQSFDVKFYLVGHFITEGAVDFLSMQHTLTALWRLGKGVYIKEMEVNLFLF